jgi:hypothetical protein
MKLFKTWQKGMEPSHGLPKGYRDRVRIQSFAQYSLDNSRNGAGKEQVIISFLLITERVDRRSRPLPFLHIFPS